MSKQATMTEAVPPLMRRFRSTLTTRPSPTASRSPLSPRERAGVVRKTAGIVGKAALSLEERGDREAVGEG